MDEQKVLTVSGLVSFLSQIEQLKDCNIEVSENEDSICISIDECTYCLEPSLDSIVEVDSEVVDTIDVIDEEGWEDLSDYIEEDEDIIEGGIIKELIKTLAIGGLVRLTKNAISKG